MYIHIYNKNSHEEKEPFESISAPLSQCYNMAETDPLVEELLKQLPR